MKKSCFGTDEFYRTSTICRNCELYKRCRKVKKRKEVIDTQARWWRKHKKKVRR